MTDAFTPPPLSTLATVDDYAALIDQHDYAVIDHYHLLPAQWHNDMPLLWPCRPELDGDRYMLPGLLYLKSLKAHHLDLLLQNVLLTHNTQPGTSRLRFIGTLFKAPLRTDAELTARFLGHRLLMRSRAEPFILRYYDPRVFVHLPRLLRVPLLRHFYGNDITDWTIFFDGRWATYPKPHHEHTFQTWKALDPERAKLDQLGFINATLTKLREHQNRPWHDLEEFYTRADEAERAARIAQTHYGFTDIREIAEFGLHSFLYGPYFHEHGLMQEVLEKVKKRGYGYITDCKVAFDDNDWAAIAGPFSRTTPKY